MASCFVVAFHKEIHKLLQQLCLSLDFERNFNFEKLFRQLVDISAEKRGQLMERVFVKTCVKVNGKKVKMETFWKGIENKQSKREQIKLNACKWLVCSSYFLLSWYLTIENLSWRNLCFESSNEPLTSICIKTAPKVFKRSVSSGSFHPISTRNR